VAWCKIVQPEKQTKIGVQYMLHPQPFPTFTTL
jgi:hypothetical protein